jgi:hypothetical protein
MRDFLVLWKDNVNGQLRVDKVLEIHFANKNRNKENYFNIKYNGKEISLKETNIERVMQFMDKEDINGEPLHDGAIIKFDTEFLGIVDDIYVRTDLIGIIGYNEELSHYEVVVEECKYPISCMNNIRKIGIVGINEKLI